MTGVQTCALPICNAPSGARCFLALLLAIWLIISALVVMYLLALGAIWQEYEQRDPRVRNWGRNAPSGARCFLAGRPARDARRHPVVMHLLALGAFWHRREGHWATVEFES